LAATKFLKGGFCLPPSFWLRVSPRHACVSACLHGKLSLGVATPNYPTTQAVFVLVLQSPSASSADCAQSQLSPKRKIPISNIHQLFCLFFAKSQNSPQHQKTFFLAAKRLLPFGFVLLLMNIWDYFKSPTRPTVTVRRLQPASLSFASPFVCLFAPL